MYFPFSIAVIAAVATKAKAQEAAIAEANSLLDSAAEPSYQEGKALDLLEAENNQPLQEGGTDIIPEFDSLESVDVDLEELPGEDKARTYLRHRNATTVERRLPFWGCPSSWSLSVSGVTQHSATLSWGCGRNNKDRVCWKKRTTRGSPCRNGPSGSNIKYDTGTSCSCSYTITGLSSNTQYTARIRKNFGNFKTQNFWTTAGTTTVQSGSNVCMAGTTGFTKVNGSISEVKELHDLQVGDKVVGLNANQLPVDDCEVVSVTTKGNGTVFGNYTADHYVLPPNNGENLVVHGDRELEGQDQPVYQVLSSCPVITDETGKESAYSICGQYQYDFNPIPWSDYLKIHATMFNLVKASGVREISALNDVSNATEHLPGLCMSSLTCMDTGECDDFEEFMLDFVNMELVEDARVKVFTAFPNIGSSSEDGSISSFVRNLPVSVPSNKYVPDYQGGKCIGGASSSTFLHDSIEACCDTALGWVDSTYCYTRSIGSYSDGWVVDHGSSKCVKDCEPAQGPPCSDFEHSNPSSTIFATPNECCLEELGWLDLDSCVANSQNIALFTGKFYVDYGGSKCAQDCDPTSGLPCMGNPPASAGFPAQLFDDPAACCQAKLGWIDNGRCVADTNGVPMQAQGSEQWYVDWVAGKCVKDCIGAAPCGGLKENYEPGHATASACCDTISWVQPSSCT